MKNWKNRAVWIGVAMLVGAFALGSAVPADDTAAGREVAAKWGAAVVKVQIVIKMSMSGESRENKSEVTGTVVDPSGLTVVSFTATNPADSFRGMFGDEGPDITTEVKDVKIRLADGKEIPAKVVLRDKDLDLAFIRPVQKPTSPMVAVDLKDSAKPEVLDQTVIVSRLGKVANRVVAAYMERIQAVVDKPRKFYTVGLSGMGNELGSPVFSMDGKVVGLVLLRVMAGGSPGSAGMGESPVIPVIIPAEDIAPVAAQAPEEAPKEPAKPAKDSSKEPAKQPAKPPTKSKTGK